MSLSWTPRNTVAVALVLLAATFYALAHFDVVHLEFISNGKIEAYSLGFGLGVVIPGSPIGRVLDKLFPPKGQTVQPITGADIEAVVTEVQSGNPLEPVAGPSQTMPQRVPSSREQGSATVDVLGALAILAGIMLAWISHLRHLWPVALLVLVASVTQGCGASALSTQARAATIVSVGLSSVGHELHDERAQALDACHDTDCESTTASAWAPAVAAYESARTALTTWIDALDVARQAGEPDGDVLGALFVAVSRLARQWNELATALRALNVDMPDLPPALAVLLSAGGATS